MELLENPAVKIQDYNQFYSSASLTIIFLASFSDVTAIIFVVACSSYNLVLREDPSQVSDDPGRYSDP